MMLFAALKASSDADDADERFWKNINKEEWRD